MKAKIGPYSMNEALGLGLSLGSADLNSDERLLAAAKTDNESLFEDALAAVEDVNYADG